MIAEISTSAVPPTITHRRERASIARRNVAAMALRCLRYRIQTGRRPIYGNVIARSGAIQKPGLISAGSLRASAFAFELWRTGTLLAMTGEIEAGSRNCLNALDHVLVFRAVFVPDRFDRVLERRLV